MACIMKNKPNLGKKFFQLSVSMGDDGSISNLQIEEKFKLILKYIFRLFWKDFMPNDFCQYTIKMGNLS